MKKVQILSLAAGFGLLAGCSSWGTHDTATAALTLDQLPRAAQSSIRNEIGSKQISSITEESKNGETAYKVEVQRPDFYSMRPSLIVGSDGAVLKESRSLSSRHVNEAAGAENSEANAKWPSSSPDSTQAPSEANPSGTNPERAVPSDNPAQ